MIRCMNLYQVVLKNLGCCQSLSECVLSFSVVLYFSFRLLMGGGVSCKQKQNNFFGLICTNKRVVGDFATLNMLVNNKGY